jgi:F-type H+-transporting ATPase subunit gamma
MAKFREIRSRIVGVENTAKITSAMKMVAAAKLRRAQDAIVAARPYGRKLRELLQFLAASETGAALSPLFEERAVERVALIVIAGDRGLAGAFNTNVLKAAAEVIKTKYAQQRAAGNLEIIAVGKRSVEYFTKRGFKIAAAYPGIFNNLDYSIARTIVADVSRAFIEGRYDRVDLIYNEFKSVMKQTQAVDQFLPIPKLEAQRGAAQNVNYIFEPSRDKLLNALLPKHLNTQLWNALLETNAAFNGAQMTAMENATQNAQDLVRSLRLSYNKARQTAITTEILEIVSGAEALRKK